MEIKDKRMISMLTGYLVHFIERRKKCFFYHFSSDLVIVFCLDVLSAEIITSLQEMIMMS